MPELPTHKAIDEDALRSSLGAWLALRWGRPDAELVSLEVPGSSGYSAETVLVSLVDRATDDTLDVVVKAGPAGHGVFPSYDLPAQVRCMEAVRRHGVPTPTVLWESGDVDVLGRPFYVMERVDGQVPRDNLPYTIEGFPLDRSPSEQRALWEASIETLAAIHSIDVEAAGLGFLDRAEHGPPGFGQQLGWWHSYREWAIERPLTTIDEAFERLAATLPGDEPGPVGLCWGDSRIGNIIFRDLAPAAVVDWEMAMLGPGEIDLAWFVYMDTFFADGIGLPRLPGFPSLDETVAFYERAGGQVRHLQWGLLFAAARFATIMVRINDRMRVLGTAPPDWTDDAHPAVALVRQHL